MTNEYRFGDLSIDLQSFRLLQAGKPLAIEPKALNVLIFLVQHPGRLIERRELLSAVWGDAFVTDHVLNRSIGQLRKALGDDAKEPRYIETVPTLGYRFIAAVESQTSQPAQQQTGLRNSPLPIMAGFDAAVAPVLEFSVPAPPAAGRRDMRQRWIVLAVSVGMVIVVGLCTRYRRGSTEEPIRSLAVLPLDDLSPGNRDDYFADGMTDELITELARIPGLRVVSRTSVMQVKGAHKPLALLAREFAVDAIVEGSVVRAGGRVRVTAQLIDARRDKHLWAQTFEGPLSDILSLQDGVARQISQQTSAVLLLPAEARPRSEMHVDPAAYDVYLRGLYFIQRRDARLAASYFRKAISLAPDFGAAQAGLAEALTTQTLMDGEHADAIMPAAIVAAKRAIQIAPSHGEAYTALGAIDATYLLDWNSAEQNLRKGVELNPSSSDAETWFAVYLTSVSRPAEAVQAMQRAVALDPLSFWANRLLGSMLYYARRYDESLAALERAAEIAPDKLNFVEGWYSAVYEMEGRYSEAVEADLKEDAAALSSQDITRLHTAFAAGGWTAYQRARAKFLLSQGPYECEMNPLGTVYVRLGNLTEAIRWFNRDIDLHCGTTVFDLASDPRLGILRQDRRFSELLHRVHLPQ